MDLQNPMCTSRSNKSVAMNRQFRLLTLTGFIWLCLVKFNLRTNRLTFNR